MAKMKSDSFHLLGRRKFLLSCALGLLGLSSTHLFLSWWQEPRGKILDYSRLASHIGVQSLGKKYLKTYPQESATHVFRSFIPRTQSGIRAQIIRDFEIGDLVSLDGWLLSRTECRLCALVVLSTQELPV